MSRFPRSEAEIAARRLASNQKREQDHRCKQEIELIANLRKLSISHTYMTWRGEVSFRAFSYPDNALPRGVQPSNLPPCENNKLYCHSSQSG